MKLLSLLVVMVALASMASAGEVSYKMLKKIAQHTMWESCWGKNNMKGWYAQLKASIKKCQGLTPTFDLDIFEDGNSKPFGPFSTASKPASLSGFDRNSNNNLNINNPYDAWMAFLAFQQSQQNGKRFKREIKMPSAEEKEEFKMNVRMFKDEKVENLGNLTCVLADMGALDENLNINMKYFTETMWRDLKDPIDPEFRAKLTECIEDCNAISQAIPQNILDKNPVYKKLGRHMIFFKCQHKAEVNLCAKQELSRYIEENYGPMTQEKLVEYGLPNNKFDAALMKKKIKMENVSPSEKFVYKFIMSGKVE